MANPLQVTLYDAGEVTASGSGPIVEVGPDREIAAFIMKVTDIQGSMDLVLETNLTGGDDWTTIASAKQAGQPSGQELLSFYCSDFLRVSWSFPGGGNKRCTFTVKGVVNQSYIHEHDIEQAVPPNMFATIPKEVLGHAALDATDEAESYLRQWYGTPIVKWNHALRMHVAKMAFFHAMMRRGYNPDTIDVLIRQGYEDALAWLKGPARYADIVDSTPDEVETEAYMVSGPPRGWLPM